MLCASVLGIYTAGPKNGMNSRGRSVSTTMECVSGGVAYSADAPTSIHTGFEDRTGIEKPPKHLVTTKLSSVFA